MIIDIELIKEIEASNQANFSLLYEGIFGPYLTSPTFFLIDITSEYFIFVCIYLYDIVDDQSVWYPMWSYGNISSFHQTDLSSLLYLYHHHGILRYIRRDQILT